MTDLDDAAVWLARWNDEHRVPTDICVLKVQEEAGEAAQAYLGWLGANPRKGITHDLGELHAELADVALAALVALASLDADPVAVVEQRAALVRLRVTPDEVVDAEIACNAVHPVTGHDCGRVEGHDGAHRTTLLRWPGVRVCRGCGSEIGSSCGWCEP